MCKQKHDVISDDPILSKTHQTCFSHNHCRLAKTENSVHFKLMTSNQKMSYCVFENINCRCQTVLKSFYQKNNSKKVICNLF